MSDRLLLTFSETKLLIEYIFTHVYTDICSIGDKCKRFKLDWAAGRQFDAALTIGGRSTVISKTNINIDLSILETFEKFTECQESYF